jgi:WD40 repeat protein
VTALVSGELVIHELPAGRQIARLSDYRKRSLDITFIPGQEAVWWASAGVGGLRRIDLATGEVSQRESPLRQAGPSSPQVSPDGEWLALGLADGRITISKEAAVRETALELGGHRSAVRSIAWAREGRRLVTSDIDGEVRVWDLTESRGYVDVAFLEQTGIDLRIASVFGSPPLYEAANFFELDLGDGDDALPPARGLAVNEDRGLVAVSAGSTVGVFDQEGSAVARLDSGFSEPLAFSPDGSMLAVGIPLEHIGQVGFPEPMIGLMEVGTREVLHRWSDTSGSTAVFSPDGRIVVFAVRPRGELSFAPGATSVLRAFDVATGDELADVDTGLCIQHLAFSADGHRLALAGCNGEVALYEHELLLDGSDALIGRTAVGGGEALLGLAVSDDGSRVYAGGLDNRITAWSADGMRQLWSIDRGKPTGRLVLRDGLLWTHEVVELLIGFSGNWIGRVAVPVDQAGLAAFARSKVVRDFTEQECHEYFQVPCAER